MTDISAFGSPVPSRLGVTGRIDDGELVLELPRLPETLHRGVMRTSVASFIVDAAAGVPVDDDPNVWTLTTDMSMRMRPVPAPERIDTSTTILRRGRRSVTIAVDLVDQKGAPMGSGAIGFATIPRKDGDGEKPDVSPEALVELFAGRETLTRPLREEAGIEVIDAAEGVVLVELIPELQNPAGTLQGAMAALVAEAAAEDLIATRFDVPSFVTDLDLRYLARTGAGPVLTSCRLLGDTPDAAIEVRIIDTSTDTLSTLAYARAVTVR